MANFPTITARQDQKFYTEDAEDTGMKSETDGGYEITRPRHTRRPRRIFTTGFTDISNADKTAIQNFYNEVGTYNLFTWINPVTNTGITVRFSKPVKFKYANAHKLTAGAVSHRWDSETIELKEV